MENTECHFTVLPERADKELEMKFWKKKAHPSGERKTSKEKTEHDIEKLRREYALKAVRLQNFMNIPTLTEMSKACQEIDKYLKKSKKWLYYQNE